MRYRGYVYDTDTGLYYLQSRYYDPETGRFVNADAFCDVGKELFGTNMFTYCLNNSVNYIDESGCYSRKLISTGVYYTNLDGPTFDRYNCYAYALRILRYAVVSPGFFSNKNKERYYAQTKTYITVDELADYILMDLQRLNRKGEIASYEQVKKGGTKKYYFIACRVMSRENYNKTKFFEYHIMRLTKDGYWRFKAGTLGPVCELSKNKTPSTIPWDLYAVRYVTVRGRTCVPTTELEIKVQMRGFYSSKTVYIKVPY